MKTQLTALALSMMLSLPGTANAAVKPMTRADCERMVERQEAYIVAYKVALDRCVASPSDCQAVQDAPAATKAQKPTRFQLYQCFDAMTNDDLKARFLDALESGVEAASTALAIIEAR